MAIVVDVTLISGKRVSLEADLNDSVQSLAKRARTALGVGHGRVLSSSGSFLDGDMTLGTARLQTGECLTLQVGTGRVRDGNGCFAAILGDGSVVTWGDEDLGGDSRSVQDQLKNATDSKVSECFCRHASRWVCRDLGRCKQWRRP